MTKKSLFYRFYIPEFATIYADLEGFTTISGEYFGRKYEEKGHRRPARISRLKVKRNKGSNRIRQRGRRGKREHGRADGRERARAHEAEADAVLSRLVRGLHILLTVHGAGASPGYGPLGQNSPCCLVCCFVCCFC